MADKKIPFISVIPLLAGIIALMGVVLVFAWATGALEYAGHEPETCNNCHVMDAQYQSWYSAGHALWAECSDCHIPHQNLVSYYLYKGKSGMKDVFSFTTASYPVAIRANAETKTIVQDNCIRCHEDTVESIMAGAQVFDRQCWDCHRTVAHGERGYGISLFQDSEGYGK